MPEVYVDRGIIHNSALACFLLSLFAQKYELEDPEFPLDLLKLQMVLPFVWNESCRNALGKRTARTRFDTVLRESPELKVDLERRVFSHTAVTFQGLNLAVSSKIIEVTHSPSEAPVVRFILERWPHGTKSALPSEMVTTVNRLANWYSEIDTPILIKLLFGIPHEISH
ncbi:three component ABC system middle component [Pseudomonas yangonensis]|uniref:three component ABC system middle component n=1 Tax=Pseudomonas yangonensis TaxID=2579922 RepID=UPI00137A5D68|nr:three component ABC system middle component [Pseudomonas yangonensis]